MHVHNHARAPVGLPHRAGSFPPRAAAFQRRNVTDALAQAHHSDDPARPESGSVVISGLGGVGKTQVALEHAEHVWATRAAELVVWVTAASREAITSTFARVAEDLTGVDGLTAEQGASRLLEWLSATSARWLIVLDDLRNPRDLHGLWPPTTSTGRVVITTRRRDAALRGHRRHIIELNTFTPDEALTYLHTALADQKQLLDGAAELTAALGYLPLALAQAGAYMWDRGLSCAEYRQRFANRNRRLATLVPEPEGLPDGHGETVAITWSLSMEQANQLEPAGVAGPLLEVASLLSSDGIPLAVFTSQAITRLLSEEIDHEVGIEEASDALGCLRRLSLISLDRSSATHAVRVHALVQRATRDALVPRRLGLVAKTAADALQHVWPDVERDTVLAEVLRANTDALANTAGEHLCKSRVHRVLFRAGTSLGNAGRLAQARDYFEQQHIVAREHLGASHPDTLTARREHARWRGHAGDTPGAAETFKAVLSDFLRVLGPDHPETLATRRSHAFWRGESGSPAEAAHALEELLADYRRVLGEDHPDTLVARHSLARWHGEAGQPAKAAAEMAEVLTARIRVLGPDHPDTLGTRGNLARWHGEAGEPAKAATEMAEVLAARERVLGPDHPDTLIARGNLARWQGESGDPTGAVSMLKEVLTDRIRVLGEDHPDTLTTRSNLARWRGESGDPAAATADLAALLFDCERVFGSTHPRTLGIRTSLARWRSKTADC
ncbi:FxSxx-COOH system tetratricopeptide repeat protein [Saccharopolyspora sp. NPDC049357]|uniref:FxSxx-COOH system tetratricopeptide repeat protein n=1 Tax=Saccharopolyspora sp. NPDC049357 TaxID=3154507 RepID=UPI00341FDFF5